MQTVLKQCAIGQLSQPVVIGQPVDTLFAGLALTHVAEKADIAHQLILIVANGGNADPARVSLATLALEPELPFPAAGLQDLAVHIIHLIGLLTVGAEHHRQLASDLVDAVAGDPDECRIDLDDLAGGIGDDDGRRGMVEYGCGAAQCRIGLTLFADIPADAQGPIEPVALVGNQHDPQFYCNGPAISREAIEI